MNLSHQRVQQIIDANGGGRRWSRRRKDGAARLACSFCGSDPSRVRQLVAGPGVHICDRCIGAAQTIASGRPVTTPEAARLEAVPPEALARCGFCGKARRDVEALVVVVGHAAPAATAEGKHGVASICDECLALCTEIIGHERRA